MLDPPEADSMFDVYKLPFIDQTGRCFGRRSAGGGTPETFFRSIIQDSAKLSPKETGTYPYAV